VVYLVNILSFRRMGFESMYQVCTGFLDIFSSIIVVWMGGESSLI
jgi:hypothetical protein